MAEAQQWAVQADWIGEAEAAVALEAGQALAICRGKLPQYVMIAMGVGWLAGWLATDCLFNNSGAATKSCVVSTTNSNSVRSIKTAD